MRLKSIKLAGFKSFVDPTTVHFPSNMAGVVGPNGCGKSNIIDAVRWVMGESSAKHLRGESMADVIFNGSNSRKPVGQASIELIFDNTGGIIKGEFARYNEVSVKRKVTRDGLSQYYLNSNKCRKKDITDLFLGTGLGPRSYAIIEQGMISRLIESKPEDLRIFIEEAAGISKYKERRRETENRMKRTKENLERLADIREELDRQLQSLQRQARAAERYKELKAKEREKKALLSSFRWNQLDSESEILNVRLRDDEVVLEKHLYERNQVDATLEELRVKRHDASEAVNRAQADFYGTGAEIAKLEQQIKSAKEREQQLKLELTELQSTLAQLKEEQATEQSQLEDLQEEILELEPEREVLSEKAENSSVALSEAEERMHDWQQEWDAFTDSRNALQRSAEIEQTRIQQTEKQIEQMQLRINGLQVELETNELADDTEELAEQRELLAELELAQSDMTEALETDKVAAKTARQQLEALQLEFNQADAKAQTLLAEEASLQALQRHDADAVDEDLQRWLTETGLQNNQRLVDSVDIQPAWEKAVESLLGERLEARIVESQDALDQLLEGGHSHPPAGVVVIAGQNTNAAAESEFANWQDAAVAVEQWFGKLQPAASIAAARQKIRQDAGLICLLPDGSLVAATWFAGPPKRSNNAGVLARKRRLAELSGDIGRQQQLVNHLVEQKLQLKEDLQAAESRQEQIQNRLLELNRQILQRKTDLSARQARTEQVVRRRESVKIELEQLSASVETERHNLNESREVWQQALLDLEISLERKEQLLDDRDSKRRQLDQLRSQARQDREHAHQAQIRLGALQARRDSLKTALEKSATAYLRAEQRREWITSNLDEQTVPLEEFTESLEQYLDLRVKQEKTLTETRENLTELENSMKNDESLRLINEQAIQEVRGKIENNRMRLREVDVRKNTLRDQLAESQFELQQLLPLLAEQDTEMAIQAEIETLTSKITRLGPINLAAIDEFESQSERKQYLDGQNEELQQALETLESAIRKIDRETRAKFKDTFDQVNEGLQSLFPKVFGGGNAYLELTGEDLLETGVAIMARPPGKKNSTIHLLSGGEKALTAIALIFSIFQLNPAPFCMLDEVDAPLDDTNVGRYSQMVKEMSAQVQFIYITHNKIAMEMADHLMGVTMHEPGVSRLVSVDVEEAAAMAAM